MIRLNPRGKAPPSLIAEGAADLPRIEALVAAGTLTSGEFKKSIYGSDEVKDLLWRAQRLKCCFCERPYAGKKWWTIEHFRPKTRADRGGRVIDIGYWWLAYEIQNLLFACPNCNTPKSDYFPLEAGTSALSPGQGTGLESPLIIDPFRDDPGKHITFEWIDGRNYYQIAALDRRGRETINAAKLDRDELTDARNKYYRDSIEPIIKRFNRSRYRGEADKAEVYLRDAKRLSQPDHPFVLLARVALRNAGML